MRFILTKSREASARKCQVESRGLDVGKHVPCSQEGEEHSLAGARSRMEVQGEIN